MNKQIGIVGWKTGDSSFGAAIPYLEYISKFGTPVILHPDSEITKLDLLILPGGPDVDAGRYNGRVSLFTHKACPIREHFDRVKLPEYIKNGTPIFGICRGMQTIAISMGASLYQNMYHEYSEERDDLVHKIFISEKCRHSLEINKNESRILVNSLHHQAVIKETLPDGLEPIAIYIGKYNKTIEAIAHNYLPIAGVQYHPEELYTDVLSDSIIKRLLEEKKSILEVSQTDKVKLKV